MDRKKRFETRQFGAGKIKVAGKSWVIVRVRLPAVSGVILLAVKMKMHSQYGNTIGTCDGVKSSNAFVGVTIDRSCDF